MKSTASTRSGRPFSARERRRIIELYAEFQSISKVAKELDRSSAGVYKVLKQESCRILSNVKIRENEKDEIRRLYFQECRTSREIAHQLGVSSTTAKYWIKRIDNPLSHSVLRIAGTRALRLSQGLIDLLPFVEPSYLRWVDNRWIRLRRLNSSKVLLARTTSARKFAYILGLYLAEGNKGKGPPDLRNTNEELLHKYVWILRSVIHSNFRFYDFPRSGHRERRLSVRVGGETMKHVLINGIDSFLLTFSSESQHLTPELIDLGFAFLKGCADGDGSVSQSKQARTRKLRMRFYLTEGNRRYARQLKKMFRRTLGAGSLYRPRNENYYLILASLSPERAATLLVHDFFSNHRRMRARLASKVLDSRYYAKFLRVYSLFGESEFSSKEVTDLIPELASGFIGRAVSRGDLVPVGVKPSGREPGPKWYRVYRIGDAMLRLAKCIARPESGRRTANGNEPSLPEAE